jgi:predicted nuclease of predicted toxin-antitoxin system
MTQWLADENFKEEILDGVWLRLPGAQIVKAKEIGLVSADDLTVLDVAATQQRILLTHDQRTIPDFAYARLVDGQPMPGVVVVPWTMPVGVAVDELELVIGAGTIADLGGKVTRLPIPC